MTSAEYSARPFARGILWGTLLFAMGAAIAVIPALIYKDFYFRDDMVHYSIPTFYHIGNIIRSGQFPFITPVTWYGGNLLGEHQVALLNPVSLALYAILPSIHQYTVAATLLVCFYNGIFAIGAYLWARAYKISPASAWLVALVVASNNFLTYWYAGNWFAPFVSIVWLPWSWAFLVRAHERRWTWVLAVAFCHLTITAGWPQTTLLLGIIVLLIAGENHRDGGWRRALAPLAASLAAVCLAAPALLPLLAVGEVSSRGSAYWNSGFMVADLRDALWIASPFHVGHFAFFGGFLRVRVPHFYIAWFIVPLLPFLAWERWNWRRSGTIALVVFAGLCLLATRGPEQLGPLRWPIRFLPYFQIAGAVLFIYLAAHLGFAGRTRRRTMTSLALMALTFIGSWQAQPEAWRMHLAAIAITAATLFVFLRIDERRQWTRQGVLAIVTIGFVVSTRLMFSSFWGETGFLAEPNPTAVMGPKVPGAFTFNSGRLTNLAAHGEFGSKQLPLLTNAATINGYTPLGHRAFETLFCADGFGWTCPQAGPRLFERDPETGAPMADLMRVNRLTVIRGAHLDAVQPLITPDWRVELDGRFTRRFVRDLPNGALPGTLSWQSPAARVTGIGKPRILSERLEVASNTPTTLLFARLYWAGYRATIDGERVPVRAHRGLFVRIDVPAGPARRVALVYRPPYFELGLAFVGLGLGLALVVLWRRRRGFVFSPEGAEIQGRVPAG